MEGNLKKSKGPRAQTTTTNESVLVVDKTSDRSLSHEFSATNPVGGKQERILRRTLEIIERSFTTEPRIRRRKTGNKSVRRTAQELVESWYPETEVSYKAMRLRLLTQFQRCSRQTVLEYLGRPATVQVECIEQSVRYLKSGTQTLKEHTFKHKLPAKKGYLELFGLATLHIDHKTGRTWFQLHHQRQTTLRENPPLESPLQRVHESVAQNASKKIFLSVIGHSPREGPVTVVEVPSHGDLEEGEKERELLSERKNQGDEHIRKQICPELSEEELRILKASSGKEGG